MVNIRFGSLDAHMPKVDSIFFFSSRRRHTRLQGDWSSDVCSSDLFLGILNALNCGDVMNEVAYALRPYEVNAGETDAVLDETMDYLHEVFRKKQPWKLRSEERRVGKECESRRALRRSEEHKRTSCR